MKEVNFKKEEIYSIRRAVHDQYLMEHEKEHNHNHAPDFLKSGFDKLGEILIAAEEEGKSSKVIIDGIEYKDN